MRGVIALLLFAVLVPTACLLWFMSEAANNERLAARQKLTELYGARLAELRLELDAYWKRKSDALRQSYPGEGSGERFARLVEAGVADSVVVYEGRSVAYPIPVETHAPAPSNETLLALREEIRSLIAGGETQAAVEVVSELLDGGRYRTARDGSGRLIVPNLRLLVLRRVGVSSDARLSGIRDGLAERLRDYSDLSMPSSQRLFLMGQMLELDGELSFATLSAERLAAEFIESGYALPGIMHFVGIGRVWCLQTPDRSVVGLYRQASLVAEMRAVVEERFSLPGAEIEVCPAASVSERTAFMHVHAGWYLPDWQFRLHLEEGDPFAAAADRKIGAYVWIGALAIVLVVGLASMMVGVFLRQARITRLKNDFVATVSHELKTPLASMRVLVDTLLEGRTRDAEQAREYLELIARENERLSRLIENFLSFSRMERNKRTFEFCDVSPEEIVKLAAEAVGERFESGGCVLEVDVAAGVPRVAADRDAMVTVLLNLLDNAYKYSPDEKRVTVRAYSAGDRVFFAVTDGGIGLSRRESRKILERFYQVDRTLSRKTGGCGLGLSIVKFIVDAHRGTIDIESRPGEGSTFAVGIPASGGSTVPRQEPSKST